MKTIVANENFNLSEEEQIKLVQQRPMAIEHLKNPSERVQLEAIDACEHSGQLYGVISEINEVDLTMTENVKWTALFKNDELHKGMAGVLRVIKNPTEEMKLQAAKWSFFNLEYIKRPSLEVQMEALESLLKSGCKSNIQEIYGNFDNFIKYYIPSIHPKLMLEFSKKVILLMKAKIQ